MLPNQKIKVVLADDHTLLRQGLRYLLQSEEAIAIVGEASNGVEVLQLLASTPADLVLLDMYMPLLDGLEVTKQMTELYPQVKVLILSIADKQPLVQKVMEAGASGFLLKDCSKEELKAAIKLVVAGSFYVSAKLTLKLLDGNVEHQAGTKRFIGPGNLLSKREVEVLELIADGYTNIQISEKLFTSKRTVETHRQNILEKTQVKNTASLIKWAHQHGYLNPPLQDFSQA